MENCWSVAPFRPSPLVPRDPPDGESRGWTSRNAAQALKEADRVLIAPVYLGDKIAPEKRLDTEKMAYDLTQYGCLASASIDTNDLLGTAITSYKQSRGHQQQLFCFFSNGSFDGVMRTFNEQCQKLSPSLKGLNRESS